MKDVPSGTRTYSPEDLSDVTFHEEGHELRADGFVSKVSDARCERARRWVESDRMTAVEFVDEGLLSLRQSVLVHGSSQKNTARADCFALMRQAQR